MKLSEQMGNGCEIHPPPPAKGHRARFAVRETACCICWSPRFIWYAHAVMYISQHLMYVKRVCVHWWSRISEISNSHLDCCVLQCSTL